MIYIFTEVFQDYSYGCCIVQASNKGEAIKEALKHNDADNDEDDEEKKHRMREFKNSPCIKIKSVSNEVKHIHTNWGGA